MAQRLFVWNAFERAHGFLGATRRGEIDGGARGEKKEGKIDRDAEEYGHARREAGACVRGRSGVCLRREVVTL